MSGTAGENARFRPVVDARPVDDPWPAMVWPVPAGAELRGKHVRLTRLDPSTDAADLFAALDHDAVWEHLAGRPGDVAEIAQALAARGSRPGWHTWLVRAGAAVGGSSPGAVVGTTSYLDADARDARLEIGWTAYTPSAWATAVNPEAKLLLLAYAFEVLHAGRVQLKTDVRNARSQRAIARLGARYEGTLRRYQRRADNTVRDTALFSIIAEEWPLVRRRLDDRLAGLAGG